MKEPHQPTNGVPSEEDFGFKQTHQLAAEMDHWLELFDTELSHQELSLSKRPLQALMMLFREGAIKVKAGEERIDEPANLSEHMEKLWFRILFEVVEYWYVNRYGVNAMAAKGSAALFGAVLIRGLPYAIAVPANRTKVETEGETVWMYFEEGLGDGEEAASWIVDGPELSKLDQEARALVVAEASRTAEVLRYVEFRRVTFCVDDDHEVHELIQTTLTYLEQAAVRLVSSQRPKIGPAWFDLQMANEAALKAVIRKETGKQPKIHLLDDLLRLAGEHGVTFDAAKLSTWPSFIDVSDWRYGQGNPPGIRELYGAYRLTLYLVQAGMNQITPSMKPGCGLLIRYLPWKTKDAAGRFRK